jgi:hypothetical protein
MGVIVFSPVIAARAAKGRPPGVAAIALTTALDLMDSNPLSNRRSKPVVGAGVDFRLPGDR